MGRQVERGIFALEIHNNLGEPTPEDIQRETWPKEMRECKECKTLFQPHCHTHVYCIKECSLARTERAKWIIFDRDDFQCFYCGRTSFNDRAELHLDHVFPKRKGGEDIASNLVTSCAECNRAKHTTEPHVIAEMLETIQRRNDARGIDGRLAIKGIERNYVRG